MMIRFRAPHLFGPGSDPMLNEMAARAILDCLPALNCGKPIATKKAIDRGMLACGPGQIVFRPACAFGPEATDLENARCLEPLLRCLTRINLDFMRKQPCEPLLSMIDRGAVFYKRTVDWDAITQLYPRGYGDCKSLTAIQCAEDEIAGVQSKPVFRFMTRQGPAGVPQRLFHILVQNPWEPWQDPEAGWSDPSKWAGMGINENAHF